MTNHLEIQNKLSWKFPKSLEFPRIFFSVQIEALSKFWKLLEISRMIYI